MATLDLSQNNFYFFKSIFDEINFENRILELKTKYPYYIDGKDVVDLKLLMKKDTILKTIRGNLNNKNINYSFTKQENCFDTEINIKGFIFYFNIKVDGHSIRGSIGILNPKREYPYHLWGHNYDSLLAEYYGYINETYRYCPLNEKDVINITNELYKIFEDFLVVFDKNVENL